MRRLLLSLCLSLSVSLPCWASASRLFNVAADDSRVDFGDVTYFDGSAAISISVWIYLETDTTGRIVCKWSGAGDNQVFCLEVPASKVVQLDIGKNPSLLCIKKTSTVLTVGAWTHILATWKSGAASTCTSSMTIYANGISQSLTDVASSAISSMDNDAASLQIGFETSSSTKPINAEMSDFGFWTEQLSQWEATTLASGTSPRLVHAETIKMCPAILGDSPEIDWCNTTTGTVTGTTASAIGPPVFFTTPLAWHHWFDRLLDWIVPSVFADDVILCNPSDPTVPGRVSSYQRSTDASKIGATANPNSLIWSLPASTINPWNGVVPVVSQSYWKCVGNTVVAMTTAEQDAINAPAVAEATRQQTFADEINGTTGNDICHADLADITTKVNAWLAARQGELDVATTNAQVKASLRDQFYPAVAQAFLKVMKCVRAVQR